LIKEGFVKVWDTLFTKTAAYERKRRKRDSNKRWKENLQAGGKKKAKT